VSAFQAPTLSHQLHQAFWRSATGDESVGRLKGLAVAPAAGGHLNDPAGAAPDLLELIWGFFRPQAPSDVTAMPDLLIHCSERDLPFAEQLAGDLPVEGLLIGFDR